MGSEGLLEGLLKGLLKVEIGEKGAVADREGGLWVDAPDQANGGRSGLGELEHRKAGGAAKFGKAAALLGLGHAAAQAGLEEA